MYVCHASGMRNWVWLHSVITSFLCKHLSSHCSHCSHTFFECHVHCQLKESLPGSVFEKVGIIIDYAGPVSIKYGHVSMTMLFLFFSLSGTLSSIDTLQSLCLLLMISSKCTIPYNLVSKCMRLYRERASLLIYALLVDVRLLTSNRNALSCWSPSVIFYSWWNLLKCACIEESAKESLVFEVCASMVSFCYAMPEILWLCTCRQWLYSPYSHAGDYKGYLTAITSIVWLTTIQLTIYRYVERCANLS